jgi:hypothetical protein
MSFQSLMDGSLSRLLKQSRSSLSNVSDFDTAHRLESPMRSVAR